ncbi:protease inhibitor I42 family protein [Cloacibacillus sp.]|uniref:protease inhibitor I42 family protein n=1 Tax=Cloacibacillus sp. TaxID=2049023 RepID=UPI0025C6CCAD|nr:protease inhibitor I42 family protein [Cloacibacillus sp.]MCC8057985.1 protease inhibitor I42 family protein [Cloacibacillus sp.]
MKAAGRILFLLATAAMLVFPASGAEAARRYITEKPLPKTASTDVRETAVEAELDGNFTLTLEAPVLPGYSWSLYNSLPPGVSLVSVSSTQRQAVSPDMTPTAVETRSYHASSTGRNRIIFRYARPGDETPLIYVIFSLNVRLK